MKRSIARRAAIEKRKIEQRLAKAVRVNTGGPVLGQANVRYEAGTRTRAITNGGMGVVQRLVRNVGLAERIDERVHLLKVHMPYHESDHVLNIAYNALCGGQTLDDIEVRRNDRVYLDALGTASIPDPTTAADYCRRYNKEAIEALQDAVNETRVEVWSRQDESFRSGTARIDADGTIVPTTGECKEGMDIAYEGSWGYSTLVVSLANTGEPLYLVNRPGNRPSHEGVIPMFDRAIALCRRGGFTDVLLRGDTDFSLSTELDRWTAEGVRFVFGYDANAKIVGQAGAQPPRMYAELARRAERVIATKPRKRPENVKERIVREREYTTLHTESEEVVEFDYQPGACKQPYRVVALKKNISVEKGERMLVDEIRYFFYITNDTTLSPSEVVMEARGRCNQENLIAQLKNGPRALHAPVNTLLANWAYMVMASLAWSIKAWVALLLPVPARRADEHKEQRRRLLVMDFRTFLAAMIAVPCQIVRTARRVVFRVLNWNGWQEALFRLAEAL